MLSPAVHTHGTHIHSSCITQASQTARKLRACTGAVQHCSAPARCNICAFANATSGAFTALLHFEGALLLSARKQTAVTFVPRCSHLLHYCTKKDTAEHSTSKHQRVPAAAAAAAACRWRQAALRLKQASMSLMVLQQLSSATYYHQLYLCTVQLAPTQTATGSFAAVSAAPAKTLGQQHHCMSTLRCQPAAHQSAAVTATSLVMSLLPMLLLLAPQLLLQLNHSQPLVQAFLRIIAPATSLQLLLLLLQNPCCCCLVVSVAVCINIQPLGKRCCRRCCRRICCCCYCCCCCSVVSVSVCVIIQPLSFKNGRQALLQQQTATKYIRITSALHGRTSHRQSQQLLLVNNRRYSTLLLAPLEVSRMPAADCCCRKRDACRTAHSGNLL
jgi:hypothetical protein